MSCARCQGFLISVPPLFLSSDNSYMPSLADKIESDAWMCINCGEYVDAVILANRNWRPSPSPSPVTLPG